ncbi:MAG: hypothetical protein KDB84_03355 [Flavobacteriales bacterium]|nr:hypothetical protein [Flavobacteriales bacterium]
MIRILSLLLFACALLCCTPAPDPVVVPSAFRWRNSRHLDHAETVALRRHGLQRVYHKLLDIDWNEAHGAHPISVVPVPYEWRNYTRDRGAWTDSIEFVPSIYITNTTFTRISEKETDALAGKLLRKLRMELPATVHGVLLDCDWTPSTRDRFFRLVRTMNDSLDVPITATVRLHQFAHPGNSGVPPADRGMLMPYNVGRLKEFDGPNSIFDRSTAEPYFRNSGTYPLPLDIALPAFSWGVHFRQGAYMGILQEADVDRALENGMLTGPRYGSMQVTREDNEQLPHLHLGDVVRVERVTAEAIGNVVELVGSAVNADTVAIAFFELGTHTFQQLDTSAVQQAFRDIGPIRRGPALRNTTAEHEYEEVPVNVPEIQQHHIPR